MAAGPGLEPGQTAAKSGGLPLHNPATRHHYSTPLPPGRLRARHRAPGRPSRRGPALADARARIALGVAGVSRRAQMPSWNEMGSIFNTVRELDVSAIREEAERPVT